MIFATKNLYLTSNSPVKSTLFAGSAFKIRDSKNKSDQKTQLSYFQVWCATDKLKFSFQFLIPRYLMFLTSIYREKKHLKKLREKTWNYMDRMPLLSTWIEGLSKCKIITRNPAIASTLQIIGFGGQWVDFEFWSLYYPLDLKWNIVQQRTSQWVDCECKHHIFQLQCHLNYLPSHIILGR